MQFLREYHRYSWGFLADIVEKNLSAKAEDTGWIPGSGRSPGEGNGNNYNILAWEIPWTEESGELQSMGSQRVRHDIATRLLGM